MALCPAFVPVFSELLEKGERARAWRVASTLFWLVLLGLGASTVLFILLAPWLMSLFGFPYEQELLVALSRHPLPDRPPARALGDRRRDPEQLRALHGARAHAGVLEPRRSSSALVIGVPAASTARRAKLYVYAGAILAGTVVQFLSPIPWLRGLDGRLQLVLDWRDPARQARLRPHAPGHARRSASSTSTHSSTRFFAAQLIDPEHRARARSTPHSGSTCSRRGSSPSPSRRSSSRACRASPLATDIDGFRETVSLGLRQIGFLLLPASAVGAVLAVPIVRLALRARGLHADQTTVVAGALAAFTLGLTFNGTMLMLNRAFFSLQSPWVPTAIALGNLGVQRRSRMPRLYRVGVWGIPLATSFVNIAGTAALLVVFRRRIGRDRRRRARPLLPFASPSPPPARRGSRYGVWYGLDAAARPLARRADPLGRHRRLAAAVVVFLVLARGCSASASCRRSSRCAGDQVQRAR